LNRDYIFLKIRLNLVCVFISIFSTESVTFDAVDFSRSTDWSIVFEMIPVALSWISELINKCAFAHPYSLIIKSTKYCSIDVASTTKSARFTISEGTLVYGVLIEDHSAYAVWLVEFVHGSPVFVMFILDGRCVKFFCKETFHNFVSHILYLFVQIFIEIKLGQPIFHILGLYNLIVKSSLLLGNW